MRIIRNGSDSNTINSGILSIDDETCQVNVTERDAEGNKLSMKPKMLQEMLENIPESVQLRRKRYDQTVSKSRSIHQRKLKNKRRLCFLR